MSDKSLPALGGKSFEELRRTNQHGAEYWSARDLQPLLSYGQWRRFEDAVKRAMTSCEGFGAVNLSQMRKFYTLWPMPQSFQTPSEKSAVPGSGRKLQTLSEKSSAARQNFPTLADIANRFPLPWSAYVRLLPQGAIRPFTIGTGRSTDRAASGAAQRAALHIDTGRLR